MTAAPPAAFAYRDGVLHAESVPLDALAAEVGTPCYVYAANAIRQRFGFMALRSGESLLLSEQGLQHDRENFRLRTPCLTR